MVQSYPAMQRAVLASDHGDQVCIEGISKKLEKNNSLLPSRQRLCELHDIMPRLPLETTPKLCFINLLFAAAIELNITQWERRTTMR